ncbi:MAG: exodeoxyribonuclease III [Clostridia bacterium]|nr:exodeoxyribonuclease III [Clostridia bacterium]
MKMVSWNVNGLRAVLQKGFYESIAALDADVICLQEIKMQKGQCDVALAGYEQVMNCADRKGYSGTAVFSRVPMLSVTTGIGVDIHDHEGRVITCEFRDFYLVCCYTPNAQNELKRLEYRMQWEDDFRAYLVKLDALKPVILTGDLNVAHQEIDLKNPKTNRRNAGFTDEERGKLTELLNAGFIDSFRYFYPDVTGAYSWWSYIGGARSRNAGWRIDYFIVSEKLRERMTDAKIHPNIMGSDHCPVELDIRAAETDDLNERGAEA